VNRIDNSPDGDIEVLEDEDWLGGRDAIERIEAERVESEGCVLSTGPSTSGEEAAFDLVIAANVPSQAGKIEEARADFKAAWRQAHRPRRLRPRQRSRGSGRVRRAARARRPSCRRRRSGPIRSGDPPDDPEPGEAADLDEGGER
jgi:hypothetical protein